MAEAGARIGFLGAGKMATALARGWLQARLVQVEQLSASDPLPAALEAFAQATQAAVADRNLVVVQRSDVLVLAVKPQHMPAVLDEIRPALTPRHLIVSIAAGIPIGQLASSLGFERRIIRVMPNTPCLVGASASAYAAAPTATAEDVQLVDRLLASVGKALRVPENLLDAVTGLSGSGPAYVAVMIEALADGGVRMGLPRDVANLLAVQTVYGSAKLLIEANLQPAQLKDMVASPGGTTIAGLHALERAGLRAALMDAVQAATERAIELGS